MNTLKKLSKGIGIICITLFAAFFVYANWEEPPMHTYVKPVRLVVYEITKIPSDSAATQLQHRLETTKGVTAAVVNRVGGLASISFYEDEVTESLLKTILSAQGNYPLNIPQRGNVQDNRPQCPIPHEYLLTFENLKWSLNLRKYYRSI